MLSFDIQGEIIKRLPVRSLIQFRSVCKAWKSLIDSSQFIAGYNVRHDQPQHLMIRYAVGYEENAVKYVSFVVDDDDTFPQQMFALTVPHLVQRTRILDSSHGLLCVYGCLRKLDNSYPTSKTEIAVLWNPTIRKSIAVVVPNNNVDQPFGYVVGFGVCFDTKDPMLVKITYIYDFTKIESTSCIPFQVMVFTLSSREWTCLCSSNLPRKSIHISWCQTVVGRFIYWLAYDRTVVNGGFTLHNLIMSFNMSTREFREVDLPDSLNKSAFAVSRIRESLVVLEYRKEVFGVWMMEHGAFTKLFNINLPTASISHPLGFTKSGKPIIEIEDDNKDFDTRRRRALVVYEPCLEHIKDLGIRGNRLSFFASSYTESLHLLDHDDGHIVRCGAMKT